MFNLIKNKNKSKDESQLKKRKVRVDYKEDDFLDTLSTRKWKNSDLKDYNIKVINIHVFPKSNNIYEELIIPEWKGEDWLYNCIISDIEISENKKTNNLVKTLVDTLKYIQRYKDNLDEIYVDDFMNVMLTILGFNEYPYKYYPQFTLQVEFGDANQIIISKVDFGVMSKLMEDKTISNAHYNNDWKEPQIIGEIFVALHNNDIKTVYGVRVVHSLFTFYKSTINEDYKNSNLKGNFKQGELVIERYPPINPSERSLNALDVCIYEQRVEIFEHLSFIHNRLSQEE
ncbi:unnamed protein product [Cunninghamella blakesleeana]